MANPTATASGVVAAPVDDITVTTMTKTMPDIPATTTTPAIVANVRCSSALDAQKVVGDVKKPHVSSLLQFSVKCLCVLLRDEKNIVIFTKIIMKIYIAQYQVIEIQK